MQTFSDLLQRSGGTAIITQARVNSTRLPNKIFLEAGGKSFLAHHIDRLRQTGLPVIIATTNNGSEAPIVAFGKRENIPVFCGSEDDVLDRYFKCAEHHKLRNIIRVTSDCPLIDPSIISNGLAVYRSRPEPLYYSNTTLRSYPRGMDYEIFSRELLDYAAMHTDDAAEREHVTPFIWRNRSGNTTVIADRNAEDHSGFRLTLDTDEDRELITELIEVYDAASRNSEEIVGILQNDPALKNINAHIEQKKI